MQTKKRNVVACLVVRLKSTRLPRKALADIGGKPMMLRLIERLKQSRTVNDIVICTSTHPDDRELIGLAETWGVTAYAGDPDNVLSRLIAVADATGADAVLRITGDNVFTCPETIDRMVPWHFESMAEYSRTNNLPLGVTAEVFSAPMLARLHEMMPDPNQSEYMMLYAFDPENYRCMVHEASVNTNRPNYSLTVDTPADLALVQRLYAAFPDDPCGPGIVQAVATLDADPEYHGISCDASIRMPGGSTETFGYLLSMLNARAQRAHKLYGMPVSSR